MKKIAAHYSLILIQVEQGFHLKPRIKTSGTCFGEVIRRPTTKIQLVIDFQGPPR